MSVKYEIFEKALAAFNKAIELPEDDITRDASIQRFEFCVELAWKTAKKHMGSSTTAPKQVVREMAQNALIQDVSLWLEAIDRRNQSSHTYNESLAKEVYRFAKEFVNELNDLSDCFKR